ncbi:MAG: alkaline phosphatase D family protein [Verrucomicrobia bacterium]|nr:alkaline phosphatase D family protein [Verrucomicrobiota bacterium]
MNPTRRAFLRHSATFAAASLLASRLSPRLHAAGEPGAAFRSAWDRAPDRIWLGAEYWANPLQDWRIAAGRLECTRAAVDRNVHLLTRQLANRPGTVDLRVRVGRLGGGSLAGAGSAGFRIGILGSLRDHPELHDYRNNLWPAQLNAGLAAGISGDGKLFIGRPTAPDAIALDLARDSLELHLAIAPADAGYTATLTALDPASGRPLATAKHTGISADALIGNLSLATNFTFGAAAAAAANGKGKAKKAANKSADPSASTGTGQFWFADWRVAGSKLTGNDDHAFGPILWSQYTLSRGVLKLSAQLPPLSASDADTVRLQFQDTPGAPWRTAAESKIHHDARVAVFRVEKWDATRDVPYRVACTLRDTRGGTTEHYWAGTVRHDPVERDELSVADISCNIHSVFPNVPYVRSMAQLNPDLLAFVGDQFYENCGGFATQRAPHEPAVLDYLRKWYFHGWTWRDLMRDRPSISLPDDHDVYQGNLWGEGGEGQKTTQEAGGYELPAAWVNVVHRTQTAHHPDPYDPQPAKRGTLNYYGPLTYGRVSFAILADRQFKSAPEGKVPPTGNRGDHVINPNFDPKTADLPGLDLLGGKQEQFLRDWVLDWRGADMKAAISQTIFTAMATTHGGNHEILMADYDASGWPQTARRNALRELRKAFAVHLAGDQHLPAVVHYGLDAHRDGPIAFAGPAVNVGYPRWWEPTKTGRNKTTGNPNLTGDFLDHFGNPLTVLAVKNGPYDPPRPVLESVNAKTSGLGLARFKKSTRTITFECWPYSADVTKPGTQMDTWPVTVRQADNYARPPVAWLPTLRLAGATDPVLQIFEEKSGELIYAYRLRGTSVRPHVFAPGSYTIKLGDPDRDRWTTLRATTTADPSATLDVSL